MIQKLIFSFDLSFLKTSLYVELPNLGHLLEFQGLIHLQPHGELYWRNLLLSFYQVQKSCFDFSTFLLSFLRCYAVLFYYEVPL